MDIALVGAITLLAFGVGCALVWYLLQGKLANAHERAVKAEGEVSGLGRQLESATEALERARRTAEDQAARVARAEAERDGALRERDMHAAQVSLAQKHLEGATDEVRALQEERTGLRERNGALELITARKDEELQTQKKWIEEQTAHLQALFSKTASELLDDKAIKFGNSNKDQIEALMKPLHLQLSEFRKRVDEVHSADTTAQAKLESHIATLAQKAADVGATATNLANAMLGNSKKQGDWGEHQLVTLLEQAGFVKGKHFDTQVGARDDDSGRRYADVVLWLPENRCLVLDSKLSLPSWTAYCSTEDPKIRETALAAMVRSMREHYESLAAIDYTRIIGREKSIPFTLMFIPIEAAGIEAFRALPELFANAQRRKVIMITPTTLFCVLQLVLGLWSIHDRHINSQHIAEQGRLLLRKLGTFMNSFKTVGDRLGAALSTYEAAKGQLQTGPGNLVSLADRMASLGVEAPKDGELAKLIHFNSPTVHEAEAAEGDHPDERGSSATVA
jgi:DNA recombination protein RmuC